MNNDLCIKTEESIMNKKYFLNRINHEWDVQYALFSEAKEGKEAYVSIGWSVYIDQGKEILACSRNSKDSFYKKMDDIQEKNRSRWSMWYVAQYRIGDIVVVPLYKEFAYCVVVDVAKPVTKSDISHKLKVSDEKTIIMTDKGFVYEKSDRLIDIGFVTRVRIEKIIPREYAHPSLIARLKIRGAVADVSDLGDYIEEAKESNKPYNFSDNVVKSVSDILNKEINNKITPDGFENLVKWYMEKIGADDVCIPAKNESGKTDNADADVIAIFNDLRVVFFIQAKKHTDKSDEWAVDQICKYKEQKQDLNDDYTYIAWAITSAKFSYKAKSKAKDNNVRLIDGEEFSEMLVRVGLLNIEDVKN